MLRLRMPNLQALFLYELDQIGRFSNLHYCAFKKRTVTYLPSSHQRCSLNKAVLKNLATFTGKQTPVLESLFNKVASCKVRPAASLKRDSNKGVLL